MKRNKNGFTLIELLAVIVVLAIVLTFGVMGAKLAIDRANEKKARIHEDNLLDVAQSYVYMAKKACPNGHGSEAMLLINCITARCPSDFINNSEDGYQVNSRYTSNTDPYKSCSITISAGDVMNGVGVTRTYSNESLQIGNQELLDETKSGCNSSGLILVYKDEYGSLDSISLSKDICTK